MARHKYLKTCCLITSLIILIITIIILTLSLTIFKPKQPDIIAHPIALKNIEINGTYPTNMTLEITMTLLVTIENPNYGSFEYVDSMGYIDYRGSVVAKVPIEHKLIPARSTVNITTVADLSADKLLLNPSFWGDVEAGSLNFTSTATLHGKVIVAKIVKIHAMAFSTCDISIFIESRDIESTCNSRIKL